MTSSLGWVVARAKTGREFWAQENVTAQGAHNYLPKVEGRVRGLACARSLFGPYFFVQTVPWRFLLGTFGVAGVVLFGESPALLRNDVIELLKSREVDGLVVLPAAPPAATRWPHGASLRVKGGVFSGSVGVYEGLAPKARERVLLDFLGRKTSVLIASELLEAA